MKKRIFALLLAAVLIFSCVPKVESAANIFFVAYNDTVPLTLPRDDGLLSYQDIILAPHTVFTVNGLGLTTSYDAEKKTVTIYSRTKRLVFDVAGGFVADENGVVSMTICAHRNQTVFLPVELCAEHFGFSVSLLNSREGYPVLRFTNGQQSYDDELFIAKAENLIAYRVQRYLDEQSGKEPGIIPPTGDSPTDPPDTPNDPDHTSPAVYLAVTGASGMREALSVLKEAGIPAVFFLTAEEILNDPALVRWIKASDYSIGITVQDGEIAIADELKRANDALDKTIQSKSLLALLTNEQQMLAPNYFAVDPLNAISPEEAAAQKTECLVICSGSVQDTLSVLNRVAPKYRRLRETTAF